MCWRIGTLRCCLHWRHFNLLLVPLDSHKACQASSIHVLWSEAKITSCGRFLLKAVPCWAELRCWQAGSCWLWNCTGRALARGHYVFLCCVQGSQNPDVSQNSKVPDPHRLAVPRSSEDSSSRHHTALTLRSPMQAPAPDLLDDYNVFCRLKNIFLYE